MLSINSASDMASTRSPATGRHRSRLASAPTARIDSPSDTTIGEGSSTRVSVMARIISSWVGVQSSIGLGVPPAVITRAKLSQMSTWLLVSPR